MSRLAKRTPTMLALGFALTGLFVAAEARAQQKIAIVDMQRAVAETTEGRKALADLALNHPAAFKAIVDAVKAKG